MPGEKRTEGEVQSTTEKGRSSAVKSTSLMLCLQQSMTPRRHF